VQEGFLTSTSTLHTLLNVADDGGCCQDF
jgi:hypothetical protein